MSLNKIITSVNALANNVSIPETEINNVVCIDTINNRIGVKTSAPTKEIDIHGTLKTDFLYINNINTANYASPNNYDITYVADFLSFEKSIYINTDLSVNNKIDCSSIICGDISSENIYVNNMIINNDLSINGDLSANIIGGETLFIKTINSAHSDISINITGNVDFVGNVMIDGSLNVLGNAYTATGAVSTSDDRLKHNERLINNGLEVVRQLEPQVYQKTKTFKEADFSGIVNEPYIIEAGLIAQEVLTVNDLSFSVIIGNNTSPYYLNYNNIFVYGLAALKELDTKVNNISNLNPGANLGNIENLVKSQNLLIQTLNTKIQQLESRINVLETKN